MTCRSQFSPAMGGVLEVALRSPGLVATVHASELLHPLFFLLMYMCVRDCFLVYAGS